MSKVKVKPKLVKTKPAKEQNTHCFQKIMRGVVDNITASAISVTYETPDGPFQAQYDPAQFIKSRMPQEGDNVETVIRLHASKPAPSNFKSTSPTFAKFAVKDQVKL